MSPETAVTEAFATVSDFLADFEREKGKKLTAILLKVANYETQEDLDFFKSDQGWTLDDYRSAVKKLSGASDEAGWLFEDNVITKQMFLDYIKFHGGSSNIINDQTDFLVQALRGKLTGGADKVHGLSPLVVQMSSDPLPQNDHTIPAPTFKALFTP